MSEHSKGPWTLDEHGDVRDANGKRLRLVGVALACGYTPDDTEPEANRALVRAALQKAGGRGVAFVPYFAETVYT